jgi:hypothetical protein
LIDQIKMHRDLAWPPSRIEMQHEARAGSIRENLQLTLDLARKSVDEADAQAAGRSPQIELGRQASPPVRKPPAGIGRRSVAPAIREPCPLRHQLSIYFVPVGKVTWLIASGDTNAATGRTSSAL